MTEEQTPWRQGEADCVCKHWARVSQPLLTKHHCNCKHYNPETEAYKIIDALLDGIMAWAADEDGIHPECWEAFKNAALFTGQVYKIKSGQITSK